jgi:hypothetical protein
MLRNLKGVLVSIPQPHDDTQAETIYPPPCPLCGRRPMPYDHRLSALLDTVTLLLDVVADLKAGIEEAAS